MTNHPLGDEIFAAYASGALSAPMKLLVDTQAEFDADVANSRTQADQIAGALLESVEPVALRDSALSELFDILDAEAAGLGEAGRSLTPAQPSDSAARLAASSAGDAIRELLNLPEAVRDHALQRGSWQFAGPGVRKMELLRDGHAKAELIRLEPGHGVPHHGHDCREFTLVLCGSFHDGINRYGRGELASADPSLQHKPVAEPGEVCIALAVTDGPLAFTGPLGWVQRALGGLNPD